MFEHLDKQELMELVEALAWNHAYGCYTRNGFEKLIWGGIAERTKWIVFLDIDNMHSLNEKHGHAGVDALIKKCLTMRSSDFIAGQHYSGDEFIVCVTENGTREDSDPVALCERLRKCFDENGIPATFAIVPVISKNLMENVGPALKMVEAAKAENRRGRIYIGGER